MVDERQLDRLLIPITAWACSRSDILALAVLGSWARGTARTDLDVDLLFIAREPQAYRYDELWLAEIRWPEGYVIDWQDVDYGLVWSRHVRLVPEREIEFGFCAPSWAATDPLDIDTAKIVANGFLVLLDKTRILEHLLAVTAP